MSVALDYSSEEKLGTFISQKDLNQILTGSTFSSQITKSYFVDPEEERINRIMEFVQEIANLMLEYIPEKIIHQVMIQFQKLLPTILEEYNDNYFTKNHIANHYLALLDYRLSLVGSKLSPKHIEEIRLSTSLKKGKTFSYFAMKQVQSDLMAAGHLKRKRKIIIPPLLKTKVTQICSDYSQAFPLFEDQFDGIREKGFELIDMQKYPQMDVDDGAIVVVASLFPYFFKSRNDTKSLWLFVQHHYNLDLESIKYKVYRCRRILKKEGVFEELFGK